MLFFKDSSFILFIQILPLIPANLNKITFLFKYINQLHLTKLLIDTIIIISCYF